MKLEDYSKYYIQGSDHYLIPKDIFIELFEEMINWKQENQQLKEEFDRMFAIYHSRKLIKKFNDEYDEEDKMKNPNRDYACVCPDAEEVYKRYYKLKEQLQQKEDIINEIRKCIDEKEEYYGDYMGDGKYQMYSMMGANNSRTPYIQSNLIKKILDNKGE